MDIDEQATKSSTTTQITSSGGKATHNVVFYEEDGELKIDPRTLKVELDDTVRFSALPVEGEITVLFPEAILADESGSRVNIAQLGDKLTVVGPADDVDRKDIYPYAPYSTGARDFIGFHSRGPVIIIYR